MACQSCYTTIASGEDVIACNGFCTELYHMKCVGLSADEKLSCLKNPHIFWVCTTCSGMLREIRYSENIQTKRKLLSTNSTDASRLTEQDHEENHASTCRSFDAIADIKTEIASIRQTLADLTASRLSVLSSTTNEQPLAHSSPTLTTQGCCAVNSTGAIPWQTCNNANRNKFWIFFSRVKNDATENDIRSMVAERLEIPGEIMVKKLVSNWTDATQLPYISFKVGIDDHLRDRAMLSSTWPSGVWFREFREKCYTWQPQVR